MSKKVRVSALLIVVIGFSTLWTGCGAMYVPLTSAVEVDQNINRAVREGQHLKTEPFYAVPPPPPPSYLQRTPRSPKPDNSAINQHKKLQTSKSQAPKKQKRKNRKKAQKLNYSNRPTSK